MTTIAIFSRYFDKVTLNLWSVFPQMLNLLQYYVEKDVSYFILDPIVLSICNIIQKDKEVFVKQELATLGKTPLQALFEGISIII